MPRVEELLAGGDADVEDLDTDGQSLFPLFLTSFFLFLTFFYIFFTFLAVPLRREGQLYRWPRH